MERPHAQTDIERTIDSLTQVKTTRRKFLKFGVGGLCLGSVIGTESVFLLKNGAQESNRLEQDIAAQVNRPSTEELEVAQDRWDRFTDSVTIFAETGQLAQLPEVTDLAAEQKNFNIIEREKDYQDLLDKKNNGSSIKMAAGAFGALISASAIFVGVTGIAAAKVQERTISSLESTLAKRQASQEPSQPQA